jgi:pilus assembly protein CpaB
MNWKTWVPLVLAIVLGVAAAKVARDVMLKNKGANVASAKFAKVVVAKADIAPGHAMTAEDLTLGQVDKDNVPASSFATVEEVVGRVSETAVVKGVPLVEAMLAPTGTGSGLQALVPPGMRAVTIEVNEFSGVAGLLSPGCRVDVIATINEGNSESRVAKTIVQNVKVTAVGQKTTAAGNEPPPPGELAKSVTVLVPLEDAEAIELACSTGRPRLVLRGGRDNEVVPTAGVSLAELKNGGGTGGGEAIVTVTAPPVAPTTAPSVVIEPTTRPSVAVASRDEPKFRVIKLIKGGQESTVRLKITEDTGATAERATDEGDMFDDSNAAVEVEN